MDVELHHITPYSASPHHDYENLIALCPNCHARADRGDIDRLSLRAYKANLRQAHDRFSQLEMDVLLELYNSRSQQLVKWPFNQFIFLKRLIDAGFVGRERPEVGYFPTAMLMDPMSIWITDAGRQFVEDLGRDSNA